MAATLNCSKRKLKSPREFNHGEVFLRKHDNDRECKALILSLKAHGKKKDLYQVSRLHANIHNSGLLEKNTCLGNALVSMYVKCGALSIARQVLDELPVRNVVSWNAIIAGYAQNGQGKRALDCYRQMEKEGLFPDTITYTCVLKACAMMGEVELGTTVHDEIVSQQLLEKDVMLATALVDMYVKCGALPKAQKILDDLPVRDDVLWSSLIAGYVQHGHGKKALNCLQRMQSEGLSPNTVIYSSILKACSMTCELEMGNKIHHEILSKGLLQNVTLGNALVDMYCKCGALKKGQEVLDKLAFRDVVSWSAMIAGYIQHGQGEEALGCFQQMKSEGLPPNAITYACVLKACGITKQANMGTRLHDEIVSQGLLGKDVVLCTALVDMYAKCGLLTKAQEVLDELCVCDVVSWNTLIGGYAQHGFGKKALDCFYRMQNEGLFPDAATYASILKVCGTMHEAHIGEKVHDEIVGQGLSQGDILLCNALVDMYAKCGVLAKAREAFDGMHSHDVISWNTLIAGYVTHRQGIEALVFFWRMKSEGISPDAITYMYVLKACGIMQEAFMGRTIHNEIASQEILKDNVVIGNTLVEMYAKCGVLRLAQRVLDQLPIRDLFAWNALISGHVKEGQGEEALRCITWMRSEGTFPDVITYSCMLRACGIMQDARRGRKFHDEIVHHGLLENNAKLGVALVDMYAKCGIFEKAQKLLEELHVRDVTAWNALIVGYVQHGKGKEALGCFCQMQSEGVLPNEITYICIVKACGVTKDADMSKKVQDEIVSQGLLEYSVMLGNALIEMHCKCGALATAENLLDEVPVRDVVSWNTLISGYTQQGYGQEAVVCFQRMRVEGLSPDEITFACILKACGITQEADMCKEIHGEIFSQGLLEKDVVLNNALVDMYAKCSALPRAHDVLDGIAIRGIVAWNSLIGGYAQHGQSAEALHCFERMQIEGLCPNVVSWSALIGGYAQDGLGKEALECFQQMQLEGVSPNAVTFVSVLNACSHAGLVDEGQTFFENMTRKYGIAPDQEHKACMVDLFGRARHFGKAMGVIRKMPFSDYPAVWLTLLGACQKWGNVSLGEVAFKHAIQLDGDTSAAYVLMANIYAAAGKQEDANNVECMRMKNSTCM